VLNLASGKETTVKDIVDTLSKLLGYSGGYDWQPERKADVKRHMADVRKAEELIGPIARTDLRDGLRETVEWYLKNMP
jgi:nucleoside-diphosphate-sugar epimerase